MADYDIFLSYARKDNQPASPGGDGWVTAFHQRLTEQHQRYAGKPLRVFFDKTEIASDEDWERRIFQGLRGSSLFVAFLSPNYIASKVCRREWEEYLRLEHTLARGDDGIKQVYFVEVPGLHDGDLAQFEGGLGDWIADIRRRNLHQNFDLRPWYGDGADQLRQIDAEERLADLRANPQSDRGRSTLALADRIAEIDRAIAQRLDKATLAAFAPGNLDASYSNFVGRSRELRQLHSSLIADKVGVVGALHGLGGQGKTALAVQYAYAYAGHYAAGGRWTLPCEGKRDLASVMEPLVAAAGLVVPEPPQTLNDAQARAFLVHAIIDALKSNMEAHAPRIAEALSQGGEAHSRAEDRPEVPQHTLLILDNVDSVDLMTAGEMAQLATHPWLQIIVTTRLDPREMGASGAFATIPVDDLPPEDALALLRNARSFADASEALAARKIVDALGGFTLGIELVGAYLRGRSEITYASYLTRLELEGFGGVRALGQDRVTADQVRDKRHHQIERVLADTLDSLPTEAREILACAALFPPDAIVVEWLRPIVAARLPELAEDQVKPGYPDPWAELIRTLEGRRLLPPSSIVNRFRPDLPTVRMHRLVVSHVDATEQPDTISERWGWTLGLINSLGGHLEYSWPRAPRQVMWLLAPFAAVLERAHAVAPSKVTASAMLVLAQAELNVGLFLRAGELVGQSNETFRRLHAARPDDAQAARDLSVSLSKLGDFFLRRGQPGDQDNALKAYQDCHETLARLHVASPDDALAARDLSVSLSRLGDFFLRRGQPGDQDNALKAYQEDLAIAERLHAANPDDAQAARDLSVSVERIGDFFLRRGQAGDQDNALKAYQESLDTRRRLHAASPDDAQAARDLSISLNRLGDFFLRRGQPGDQDKALKAYQESLAVAERLHATSPDDAQAARDLSVSLSKLGNFFLRRGQAGDQDNALKAYQESLDTRRRLHAASPDDAQAARDLSVSLNNMGDFFLRRGQAGDQDKALKAYQDCHEKLARLHAASPDDAQAARDLSVSLNSLGDFFLRRGQPGDKDNAFKAYQESLAVVERLHAASPDDAQAARDLSVSLSKLGDFFLRRGQAGDQDNALKAYQDCHETLARLHAASPDDALAARDLSVSLNRLGDFFLRRGQPGDQDKAFKAYQEDLTIVERLHAASPDDAQAARDLSVSLSKLGNFFLRRGQPGDQDNALRAYQESLDTRRRLHAASPDDAQAARDLSVLLTRLGDFFVHRGQPGDQDNALKAYQEDLAIAERLHAANPDDAQVARDLSVSYLKLGQILAQIGDHAASKRYLADCFAILDSFHRAGRQMEQGMRQLHAQLASMFDRNTTAARPQDADAETDERVFAMLADPGVRQQLDQLLKANGVAGGIEALSEDDLRSLVRRMVAESGIAAVED